MKTKIEPADVQAAIVREDYFHVPHTTTTVCALTVRGGFVAVGKSACVDPENFNLIQGRKIARDDALNGVWQYLGTELRVRMNMAEEPTAWQYTNVQSGAAHLSFNEPSDEFDNPVDRSMFSVQPLVAP